MKVAFYTLALLFLSLCSKGQGLRETIENKIWKLSECYVNNISYSDSLYLKFESSGDVLSGYIVQEFSDTTQTSLRETYIIQNISSLGTIGGAQYPKIIINDGEEDLEFDVLYYDDDDLVLQTILISSETGLQYQIEHRYIVDE